MGLPEDLLTKGRRTRVMHLPPGVATGLHSRAQLRNAQQQGVEQQQQQHEQHQEQRQEQQQQRQQEQQQQRVGTLSTRTASAPSLQHLLDSPEQQAAAQAALLQSNVQPQLVATAAAAPANMPVCVITPSSHEQQLHTLQEAVCPATAATAAHAIAAAASAVARGARVEDAAVPALPALSPPPLPPARIPPALDGAVAIVDNGSLAMQQPRVPTGGRLRRFSTETNAAALHGFSTQLAELRLQQAQYSERAVDGLLHYDVPADEVLWPPAATAAAAWSRMRPPRRRSRRLSARSALSVASSGASGGTGDDVPCSSSTEDYEDVLSGAPNVATPLDGTQADGQHQVEGGCSAAIPALPASSVAAAAALESLQEEDG